MVRRFILGSKQILQFLIMSDAARNNASRAGLRETWKSALTDFQQKGCSSNFTIGTEVKIFHVTSPQRVKKCDAGTYVVLSGDTNMLSSCQVDRQCRLKG